jgi:hypothetical protein
MLQGNNDKIQASTARKIFPNRTSFLSLLLTKPLVGLFPSSGVNDFRLFDKGRDKLNQNVRFSISPKVLDYDCFPYLVQNLSPRSKLMWGQVEKGWQRITIWKTSAFDSKFVKKGVRTALQR